MKDVITNRNNKRSEKKIYTQGSQYRRDAKQAEHSKNTGAGTADVSITSKAGTVDVSITSKAGTADVSITSKAGTADVSITSKAGTAAEVSIYYFKNIYS